MARMVSTWDALVAHQLSGAGHLAGLGIDDFCAALEQGFVDAYAAQLFRLVECIGSACICLWDDLEVWPRCKGFEVLLGG